MTGWLILELFIGLFGGFAIGILISISKITTLESTIDKAIRVMDGIVVDTKDPRDMKMYKAYKILRGADDEEGNN